MHDPLILANEALFMSTTEVRVEFVVTIEALLAEGAHRVYLYIYVRYRFFALPFMIGVPLK